MRFGAEVGAQVHPDMELAYTSSQALRTETNSVIYP